MKKHNIFQSLKNKGFYVVFFIGVVAIAIVSVVGVKLNSKDNKNLADLNTPIESQENTNIAEGSKNLTNTTNVADSDLNTNELEKRNLTNDELLEYDVYGLDGSGGEVAKDSTKEQTDAKEIVNTEDVVESADVSETKEQESISVMQPKAGSESLSFSLDTIMSWPVKGNVILPYSMDKLVHFATLGEWKVNPAIVISCEAGTEVTSACKGVVSEVAYDEETGNTVSLNVGNGYEVTYGQLENVTCKVGDVINEGSLLGTIAKPTMYYSVEGSNLYLQVTENGKPVNPMLFLVGEE